MGFTIEDMMILSREQYSMRLVAGNNGWANSINWIHLVEDTTIIQNFWGRELAVTTGLGFKTVEKQKVLVQELIRHHGSGLIVNIGKYIPTIDPSLIKLCDDNDFPLLTVPWETHLSDMLKELSIRVFMQDGADAEATQAMILAIEHPENQEEYRKKLLPFFDVDGSFQVVLITTPGLDEMDTVERKKLAYRIQVYFEEISHNGNFFYYDSFFVLAINDLKETEVKKIVAGMCQRAKRRMPDQKIYVGVGSRIRDIRNLGKSFHRAKGAATFAAHHQTDLIYFDSMEVYRILYAVEDTDLLQEMAQKPLQPLLEYDVRHHANYVETLELYLHYNGSIQEIAKAMYTHRNTVVYRINNIKKLLKTELSTPQERLPFQIAYYIRKM